MKCAAKPGIRFDDVGLRCWRGKQEIHLSLQQWRLVNALRFASGVVSKERLGATIGDLDEGSSALRQIVYQTRKKLEINPAKPAHICTCMAGYIWRQEKSDGIHD